MRARVPASSANLGPGYDALALALDLHLEVTLELATRLELSAEGEGAELAEDPASHLGVEVARRVLGHDSFALHVSSEIPVARGLGSSAALAVAVAAAAGANDPLQVGAATDGHAENAAASLLGGLVAAVVTESGPIARRLPLDEDLRYVLVVPDRELGTKQARAVLPESVPLADATYNLGHMGLLLAGLADRRALTGEAGADRLHQGPRTALFEEAPELIARLRRAGAVATWSGAGPSLLAICPEPSLVKEVSRAGEAGLEAVGLTGRVIVLRAELDGLVLRD